MIKLGLQLATVLNSFLQIIDKVFTKMSDNSEKC